MILFERHHPASAPAVYDSRFNRRDRKGIVTAEDRDMIACRFAADCIAKQQRPLTDSESRLLVEFLSANRRRLAGHYARRYSVVCDDEIDDAFEDGMCRLVHVITRNAREWTEADFRDIGYRTAWRGMVGYRFALLALSRSGKGERRIGCRRTRLALSVSRSRGNDRSGPGIYVDELRLGGAGEGLDWDAAWLDCIVDELADADRELLLAYYVAERRPEDIAARLGVRRNQVMHRLHGIVCRIRRELGLPAYDLAEGETMSRGELLTALGANLRTLRKLQAVGLLAGLSLSPQGRYSQSDLDAAEDAIASLRRQDGAVALDELCLRTGCSERDIRRWRRAGQLSAPIAGPWKCRRYTAGHLAEIRKLIVHRLEGFGEQPFGMAPFGMPSETQQVIELYRARQDVPALASRLGIDPGQARKLLREAMSA